MYIQAIRTVLTSDWNNFQEAAAVVRKTYKQAYDFVSKVFLGNSSTNPRQFFSHVKTKSCENIVVAPLHENGTIVTSNTEKACVLNNQFCSVFIRKVLEYLN